MVRKILKRLLGEGVEYETALATALRDSDIPVATPEERGPLTSKASSKRLRSDDSFPGAEAIKQRESWERAALQVIEGLEMPKPHVCVVFIPDDLRRKRPSPESVLNRLRRVNRALLTQEWKNLRCEEFGSGHTWTLSMDEGSGKTGL
ncbi:hypothetical protein JTB14_032510 [Gonioctena quinquepunctata]|nr:hypothetical protein JTB14_032510 [Gonioctena quinquepunctata]